MRRPTCYDSSSMGSKYVVLTARDPLRSGVISVSLLAGAYYTIDMCRVIHADIVLKPRRHQEIGLCWTYTYSSASCTSCHVWSRCHWCSENRLWQDYRFPATYVPTYQRSTTARTNGGTSSCCHDPDSRTCRPNSPRVQALLASLELASE